MHKKTNQERTNHNKTKNKSQQKTSYLVVRKTNKAKIITSRAKKHEKKHTAENVRNGKTKQVQTAQKKSKGQIYNRNKKSVNERCYKEMR